VLLLNATYEPLRIVSWQKAMILWFQEKAEIVVTHERLIRSFRSQYNAPAVLRMKNYIKPRSHRSVRLSRDNIFLRDKHTCQYCAKKLATRDLTLDHVMPVSRGGGKSWENLVAACHTCNRVKASRTPNEAGMPLLNEPTKLKWSPTFDIQVKFEKVDSLWEPYLDSLMAVGF
jgi:5-methylcytosine-specific restriction endonuclease McrA